MTIPEMPVTDTDLHAYVDGQLPGARIEAVEAALLLDADLAARAAAYRAQNTALRAALDPWLAEPLPADLLSAALPASGRRPLPAWKTYGGWAAMLMIGTALGWGAREATLERAGVPTTFAQQAAFTHALYAVDQRRPVEVSASEEQSLVTWLTKRTGQAARAPDLSSVGYHLVGGRLVAGNEVPTALLMYENADKERLTLQWRRLPPGTSGAAFRYDVENGVGVFYWIDAACAYAISGTIGRSDLLAVAHVVYAQLVAPAAAGRQP
jgi:anti-sigma factor RsiW